MRISRRWTMLVLVASLLPLHQAHAIPAWARKYNMNCDGCHYPAVPRLNAKGFMFKWAGYRMPDEIGEKQEATNVSNYLAARFRFQYVYNKTSGQDASASAFNLSDATIFAGGSIGKNFGAFMEFEAAPDELELTNHVMGVWGHEQSYGGVRFGLMHWLLRGGLAGMDRPMGISTVSIFNRTNTAGGVPFKFSTDEMGAEAFYVMNHNRLSAEVLNGISPAGKGDEAGSPKTKDFAIIDQFMYDAAGSGITAAGYFGAIPDLDSTISSTAHYTRFVVTANKFLQAFEVQGGYMYAKDNDLPSTFASNSVTGNGWFVYGGYTFPSNFTGFARYEFANTNTDIDNSGATRFVLGGVMPFELPEYFRLAAEYTLDNPRAPSGKNRNGAALEAMLNF